MPMPAMRERFGRVEARQVEFAPHPQSARSSLPYREGTDGTVALLHSDVQDLRRRQNELRAATLAEASRHTEERYSELRDEISRLRCEVAEWLQGVEPQSCERLCANLREEFRRELTQLELKEVRSVGDVVHEDVNALVEEAMASLHQALSDQRHAHAELRNELFSKLADKHDTKLPDPHSGSVLPHVALQLHNLRGDLERRIDGEVFSMKQEWQVVRTDLESLHGMCTRFSQAQADWDVHRKHYSREEQARDARWQAALEASITEAIRELRAPESIALSSCGNGLREVERLAESVAADREADRKAMRQLLQEQRELAASLEAHIETCKSSGHPQTHQKSCPEAHHEDSTIGSGGFNMRSPLDEASSQQRLWAAHAELAGSLGAERALRARDSMDLMNVRRVVEHVQAQSEIQAEQASRQGHDIEELHRKLQKEAEARSQLERLVVSSQQKRKASLPEGLDVGSMQVTPRMLPTMASNAQPDSSPANRRGAATSAGETPGHSARRGLATSSTASASRGNRMGIAGRAAHWSPSPERAPG